MIEDERISQSDLAVVREARLRAELATKESQLIEARVFIRYELCEGDEFDVSTGAITRRKARDA